MKTREDVRWSRDLSTKHGLIKLRTVFVPIGQSIRGELLTRFVERDNCAFEIYSRRIFRSVGGMYNGLVKARYTIVCVCVCDTAQKRKRTPQEGRFVPSRLYNNEQREINIFDNVVDIVNVRVRDESGKWRFRQHDEIRMYRTERVYIYNAVGKLDGIHRRMYRNPSAVYTFTMRRK